MAIFDYGIEAQLAHSKRDTAIPRPHQDAEEGAAPGYGRFARAADAIRFAIEELAPELLPAAQLKVAEERFDSNGIRRLYESDRVSTDSARCGSMEDKSIGYQNLGRHP